MLKDSESIEALVAEHDNITLRSQRLLQVSVITLSGLILVTLVADERIRLPLLAAELLIAVTGLLAWRRRPALATTLFLWTLTLMLTLLAWHSEGIRDLSLLAYPGVLIFAAIFGSQILFLCLLLFMVGFTTIVGGMTLAGLHHPYYYAFAYRHIIFVDVILLLTGFSAYILLRDQRKLLAGLKEENQRARKNEKTIGLLANQDQLTGLANRRYAEHTFARLWSADGPQQYCLAILFIDLDNFKPVNDSLGHAAGDLLLQQLAQRMRTLVTDDDVLCRFGGDEFLLLTRYQTGDETLVTALADALISATILPFFILQTRIEISASIGIALAPDHGKTFSELCRHADLAMYRAKDDGRHKYRIYQADMSRASVDKLNLTARLRAALKQREFQLHYQPLIDIATQQVIGVEALIRWPQSDGSLMMPDDFIPLAESSGLITEMGDQVLRQACHDCAGWHRQGFTNLTVSVNLSYVQFRHGELVQQIESALQQSGLPADALELELTESMLIGEDDHIQQQINTIHRSGVHFAIDDFGTGYSNLGYLRRFNASRLKIDKSFVSNLSHSERDRPLVQAIIQMTDSLGLLVVAEGVEDKATFQQLQQMGCDQAQGYLWSEALPEAGLIEWMKQYRSSDNEPPANTALL